jgi:hypothetical protein
MRKVLLGGAVAACAALAFQVPHAGAQGVTIERVTPVDVADRQVYTVPFLCGTVAEGFENGLLLGPGAYFTSVNIFNWAADQRARVRIRVVEALPGTEDVGRAGVLDERFVRARRAIQIDCADIAEGLARLNQGGPDVAGGGELQPAQANDQDLEVIAIYNHAPDVAGDFPGTGGLLLIQAVPVTDQN